MIALRNILCVAILASVGGCSFMARSVEDYRKDTRALIETKNDDIKTCYDTALAKDPKAGGTVVVRFKVKAETGQVAGAQVLEDKSTADKKVGKCVVKALEGLHLTPPDGRDGAATFTWEFSN